MDRGAWRATVHGVAKNWTQLSMHTCTPNKGTAICQLETYTRKSHVWSKVVSVLLQMTKLGQIGS